MVNLGILTVDASASSDDDEYDPTEFTHRSSTSGRSPFFLHTKYVWDRPESDDEDEDCSTSMGATQRRFLDSLRDSVDVSGWRARWLRLSMRLCASRSRRR